ncbi:MAG: hypothetical protein Q4D31_06435 [Eubacteriales bacterium]|nr:hypothetical protein [Eubacteriales bacterium]
MTPSRDSVAYKQYEERSPARKGGRRDLHVAPTPRRRKKSRLRPSFVGCLLVLAVAAVYILCCQMQLTELTATVSRQSALLDELTAENVSLTTKKMNSMNMSEVEEHAVNQLGMVKMDNARIEYVELTNPDTVTVAESRVSLGSVLAGVARSFSAIVEYIN